MDNSNRKFPELITGLAKKPFGDDFVLDTMTLSQEQVDAMCAVIQTAVGGKIELREWNGTSRNGKKLPGYKLQAVTAEQLAERNAYGATKKASRASLQDGDNAL